jgi:NAD(P)H-nitrite reductase large subunit
MVVELSHHLTQIVLAVGPELPGGADFVDQGYFIPEKKSFAVGDAVQLQGVTRCSAREAAAQGRLGGANLVAALQGRPLTAYTPDVAPLVFKTREIELYALGEPAGEGSQEWFLDATEDSAFRALVLMNGVVTGVQMVGTRQDFDHYAEMVRRRAEYQPPPRG